MKKLLFITILLFLYSPQIRAEVKTSVEKVYAHGFVIKNTATTAVSRSRLWHHFVSDIDAWWPKDHSWWGRNGKFSLNPEAGGCFCEHDKSNSAEHMRVSFVEPEKRMVMTGGLGPLQGLGMYGALTWEFADMGNDLTGVTLTGVTLTGVTLTYRVHGIYEDDLAKLADLVATVQGIQLKGLIDYSDSTQNAE